MGQIWVTSDWHFGHTKEFLWGPRGFANTYEMADEIIKRYNAVVQPGDDVYFLGDGILEDNEFGRKCIAQLKGNIHVCYGNHDTDTRKEIYNNLHNIVEVGYANVIKYGKYHFYLSHYPTLTSNYDTDKPLCRQVINLCGHSHALDKFADFDKGLIYHCECDAHASTPVNIEQIINDIKERLGK